MPNILALEKQFGNLSKQEEPFEACFRKTSKLQQSSSDGRSTQFAQSASFLFFFLYHPEFHRQSGFHYGLGTIGALKNLSTPAALINPFLKCTKHSISKMLFECVFGLNKGLR